MARLWPVRRFFRPIWVTGTVPKIIYIYIYMCVCARVCTYINISPRFLVSNGQFPLPAPFRVAACPQVPPCAPGLFLPLPSQPPPPPQSKMWRVRKESFRHSPRTVMSFIYHRRKVRVSCESRFSLGGGVRVNLPHESALCSHEAQPAQIRKSGPFDTDLILVSLTCPAFTCLSSASHPG